MIWCKCKTAWKKLQHQLLYIHIHLYFVVWWHHQLWSCWLIQWFKEMVIVLEWAWKEIRWCITRQKNKQTNKQNKTKTTTKLFALSRLTQTFKDLQVFVVVVFLFFVFFCFCVSWSSHSLHIWPHRSVENKCSFVSLKLQIMHILPHRRVEKCLFSKIVLGIFKWVWIDLEQKTYCASRFIHYAAAPVLIAYMPNKV